MGRCQSAGEIIAARRRRAKHLSARAGQFGMAEAEDCLGGAGCGTNSYQGSQDKKRSRELFLALTQYLSCRRKEQASFPALLINRVQPILGKSIPN